jgi:lycopene beta-cyclase
VGLRGAFFHPTTGYSLPQALATAFWIGAQSSLDTAVIAPALRARSIAQWRRTGFYRALNRMLFLAAEPGLRYRVLERFYGLSDGLIERFYAGKLEARDKLRLLVGRPPVPVLRALKALPEHAAGELAHG